MRGGKIGIRSIRTGTSVHQAARRNV
jgi:hypothetical protein